MNDRPDAILIAGPTASGKSALAMQVAAAIGAVVINADSMQVYADLRIVTARPSEADEHQVPHALYGMIDGTTNHSVSQWLANASHAIKQAEANKRIPLFVGGTGLYFKALTRGLSEIPQVPADVRAELRAWADGRDVSELYAELKRRDPVAAERLRPTDPQRILRALEVHMATGESLTTFHARREPGPLSGRQIAAYALEIDRTILRERIDKRFDEMVHHGALGEVEALAKRALDPSLPIMRAIGVPSLLQHIAGDMSLDDATDASKAATRAYIKRQSTFFRNQLPEFEAIEPAALAARLKRYRQLA